MQAGSAAVLRAAVQGAAAKPGGCGGGGLRSPRELLEERAERRLLRVLREALQREAR